MPPFPDLNTTDINNLFAYLQSTGTSSEPIFNLWWEAFPTASLRLGSTNLYAAARTHPTRTSKVAKGKDVPRSKPAKPKDLS